MKTRVPKLFTHQESGDSIGRKTFNLEDVDTGSSSLSVRSRALRADPSASKLGEISQAEIVGECLDSTINGCVGLATAECDSIDNNRVPLVAVLGSKQDSQGNKSVQEDGNPNGGIVEESNIGGVNRGGFSKGGRPGSSFRGNWRGHSGHGGRFSSGGRCGFGDNRKPQMKLKLCKPQEGNVLHLERREDVRGDWEKCLIGYFLNKKPSYAVDKNTAFWLWNKSGLVDVHSSEEGFFYFVFDSCSSTESRDSVMDSGEETSQQVRVAAVSTKTSLNAVAEEDVSNVATPVENIVKGKNSSGKRAQRAWGRKNKR
ncbi:hypothetical protein Acr_01g0010560 [Actinidia rufa]|uniref:DUF4283 domain-containing protein n=1 Tax=Actinidia rufa TaxID=165716 RepID=A0A7J0E6F5_9ERIC|nr:hypothetical protein Acr_01g0010560 [Actinidia rufa]